ncbi:MULTISPECIES: TonB-dependent receptor [unclassified Sphingomonas]|uniref:TonB-dependent receptor n=1 Tax=unclassified Sphingomonas TaxID=196159 RepID=UPI000831B1E2|nr:MULTISPECIES: TonB-dependent receptor [unclassified Sphingomonas]
MTFSRVAVLLAGTVFAAPTGALAQGTPANAERSDTVTPSDIIVTGTKSNDPFGGKSGVPLDQVPQGVQVVDRDDILARDACSIGDALRGVPSANIGTPRTGAFQSFSIEVRGFLADQMRNGVRQRYYEDVDASNITNIERIEVLKGPSGVLFGQSALGGIISIITKQPEDTFSGYVSAVGGSYERAAASFDVTGPVSGTLSLRLNGEIERSGTYVDFQDIDRENLAFSARWTPAANVAAHLVTEWNERRTQRNPGLPIVGTVVDNGVASIPIGRFLGDPGRSGLFAASPLVQAWVDIGLADNWNVAPRVSYSRLRTGFTQLRVRDVAADGVTVNRNGRYGFEDDDYVIAQVDVNGVVTTGPVRHNLLLGVERSWERGTFLQEDIVDGDGNSLVPPINALNPAYGITPVRPYAFGVDFESEIDGWALYLQDRIDLTDRWNVVAGVRWSDFDTESRFSANDRVFTPDEVSGTRFDTTTFQIGTTYRVGGGFSLFGGYATGFDIENVSATRDAAGNPLDPEESEQVEAGIRYAGAGFSASLSAFDIRRTNVATPDPVNDGFSIQTGEVRVRGIELEGTVEPVTGLTLQGGYAFLDSEVLASNNGDQGDDLADVARHQANFFSRWKTPVKGLELRGGGNYVGPRRFSNVRVPIFSGLLASEVRLPDYVTVDLGAAYSRGKTRFDMSLTNLFDARYFAREFNEFSVLPGEPFQASLRVTQAF